MPRAKPTKKRKFYGNKYTRPLKETAKPCASEEKLQYTKKRSVVTELDGYRLIDVRNLVNFVSAFTCPNCGGHGYTVTEDIAGLRSSLSFECMNHDCGHTYKLNSQPDGESVNTRFEMAMFSIGRNRQQAVCLLGEMNMPPPVSCTMWNKTKDKIHEFITDGSSWMEGQPLQHQAVSVLICICIYIYMYMYIYIYIYITLSVPERSWFKQHVTE